MKGIQLSTSLARSTSVFALAASLAAPGVAWAQPPAPDQSASAPAQTADAAAEGDDIVVTGIRGSLTRAMDIKRDSQGVVDAISAEDIGKFPDTNLAESLQRIPGVTIDRVNGEGSQVTVRGFGPTFNLVTLNGRQLATSSINAVGGDENVDFSRSTSRSFDFSNLASEGVSRLEVYKTGRAALPSGGIGATINVVSQRPLDVGGEGLRGSIGAKALYDTSLNSFKITPEASGILTWSDTNDTFGVTVFGSYQKRESAAASATSNDWNITTFANMPGRGPNTIITNAPTNPAQLIAVPNDSRYHYSTSTRERINGQATMEFRPMETMTIIADALYAQNKINEARSDQTNWFNRPFDHVTFDGNPTVATATYLDEGAGYSVKDLGFEQQYRATKTTLQSYGLNMNWEVVDQLTLKLDGNHSESKSVPNSRNGASSTLVSFGAPVVDKHSVDFTGGIPVQHFTVNDMVAGNKNGVLDIGDLGTQVQRTNATRQSQKIDQLRADLGWDFGGGGRFDLGTAYVDSKMTSARIQTQQTLGDWGITRVGDVQQLAGSLVQQYCLACKFDHYTPGDAGIAFRGNAVDLYEAFAQAYVARGNPINISGNDYDQVREKVWSAYAQFTWNGELAGRKANFTAGARYENTKVTSNSIVASPDYIKWDSDNDFTKVVGTQTAAIELKGEYNNLLPAIDFRLEPMDNVVARISYSKTLARPDYGNLFASQSANGPNRPTALQGRATGSSGDPNLKPLVSDNFDISMEYYFGPSSYFSAGFFYKKVKNFVGVGQVEQPLFGLRDPSSGAAGSRSGTALAQLNALAVPVSDVSLFTMTALLIQNNGNLAAATQQFLANYSNGQLNQQFVDQVLAQTDVIPNTADPLFNFSVATPINNKQGNIHGFEIQGQYFFGNSGFGVSGSFTKVYGDIGFDIGASPNTDVFALVGLSDSYNVTGIYEKNGFAARIAYNWRGKYLASVNRGASRNPVFYAPFGTLDLSLSYDVMQNLSLSLEAVNLTSEPVRTYARSKDEIWFAQEQKPRVWLGARYRF